MNTWPHLLFTAIALVVGVGASLWTARAAGSIKRVRRYGADKHLPPLAPADEISVADVQRRTAVRLIVPFVLVAVFCCAVALLIDFPLPAPGFLLQLVPLILTLSIVGAVVTAGSQTFRPAADAPRIARVTAITTKELIGSRLIGISDVLAALALVSALGLGITFVVLGFVAGAIVAFAAVVLGAIAVVLLRRLERRVLERPQPASSPVHLAWDDALAADTLMMLRLSTSQIAAVGVFLPVILLLVSFDQPGTDVAAGVVSACCFLTVIALQSIFQVGVHLRAAQEVTA